jgi:pilus assembly protein CpaF
MPLITSHARLAEQYANYFIHACPDHSLQNRINPLTSKDLIPSICNRILTTNPLLVADVAAGRSDASALEMSIMQTTEMERERAGLTSADLVREVMDFLFGYGPLQSLIDDESITDIDGTRFFEFTIKRNGIREAIPSAFPDAKTYDTFCRLVVIRNGGLINENDSHCRVTDEQYRLRINVTVPPRSLSEPTISIRRHRRNPYSMSDLENVGMLSVESRLLIQQMAQQGKTVLFCGKGAAGKTTILRAFIESMPRMERVLIAESDSELYPEKPYCLMQRIKKPHEGGRTLTLRDLVADGLTMSLDTYCIGEIVGAEAAEFIRAAYSGHRCLGTIHSESACDAIDRILSLARAASPDESEELLHRMLLRGVDYLIFLQDFKVCEIVSISNKFSEENRYALVHLWPANQNQTTDTAFDYPFESLVPSA